MTTEEKKPELTVYSLPGGGSISFPETFAKAKFQEMTAALNAFVQLIGSGSLPHKVEDHVKEKPDG